MDVQLLLTFQEINVILYEATNPKYLNAKLFNPGFSKTDIIRISQDKRLILFKGNEQTGYQHIQSRHSPTGRGATWPNGETMKESSKFSFDHTPAFYIYLVIAEAIYSPTNLNLERNSRSDYFDLYTGLYTDSLNITTSYKLLLYKDTKIIHNLFPKKPIYRKFKPVKGFNFKQGSTGWKYDVKNAEVTYEFRYFDSLEKVRISVKIITQLYLKTEKWAYDILDESGKIIKTIEFPLLVKDTLMDMHDRATNLTYFEDLTQLKRSIKRELNAMNTP